ncbi:MAG: hemolysin family protein [Muribaculaceae bacterium]|nr:hemolysin family protein [Muribaculaceae bacterium]
MDQSWCILILITIILSAIFSGVEIAFVTSDRVRVELDIQRGGVVSKILNLFYTRPSFFISTILVGNNIALVVYGMGTSRLLDPMISNGISNNPAVILLISTIVSTAVILITGEFLPKSIFRINPNASLKLFSIPIYLIYLILYPISLLTTWISRLLMRIFGVKDAETTLGYLSLGDLNEFIERTMNNTGSEGKEQQIENEVKIFHNALDFSTIHLRDCMTPRNEIVAVDIDNTTSQQLSELFTSTGRSKILVYREDIDNILGYIHVSELFHPEHSWEEAIKPVIFAPETLLANKMMRRLLTEKRSMAIIIDEFGGTAGMVTLEDLVEEIFGDIQDEHDLSGLVQHQIAPNVFEFSGRMEIEAINELYHLNLPESDDYQTLAGFIMHTTGSLPKQGETIIDGNLTMQIMKKSATRLELIRLTVNDEKEDA